MRSTFRIVTYCLVLSLGAGALSTKAEKPGEPASSEAAQAEYLKKLDDRVGKIVSALGIQDEAKRARVHALVVAQYRTLNSWHETNDARLKELKKTSPKDGSPAADEISSLKNTLKQIHETFLTALGKDLSDAQIETIKDGMTVGKVQFTYKGYVQQIPSLTEEQKAKILELLKEAREEAMDAGSMEEKSDIFNRYKGKINNWLSKQGVDQGSGKKKADKK
ncbi:MAG: DUF3826 domain-containing protein [Nibricoccus sp.]